VFERQTVFAKARDPRFEKPKVSLKSRSLAANAAPARIPDEV